MSALFGYPGLRRRHPLWIHGHRGSASTRPENTMASFEEAVGAGVEFIELDLHLSADGVPVVFHDEYVSSRVCRDTHGRPIRKKLAVRLLSAEALGAYDVGTVRPKKFRSWHEAPGQKIPLFADVCAWIARQEPAVGLNVELKMGKEPERLRPDPDEFARKVVSLIGKHGLSGRVQLQSFYPDMVAALRAAAPAERVSYLVDRGTRWVARAKTLGADAVGPHFRLLTPKLVAACHGAGLGVVPWTVNEPVHWHKLLGWGVDGLITDYPRKLVQWISQYN